MSKIGNHDKKMLLDYRAHLLEVMQIILTRAKTERHIYNGLWSEFCIEFAKCLGLISVKVKKLLDEGEKSGWSDAREVAFEKRYALRKEMDSLWVIWGESIIKHGNKQSHT